MKTDLLDSLIVLTKEHFEFGEHPDRKLRQYFFDAMQQGRFMYLYHNNQTIGFLVYYLYNLDECKKRLQYEGQLKFLPHNPKGDFLFVDTCVIFGRNHRLNLLYLRRFFKQKFPQMRFAVWHKSLGDRKKLFVCKT